MRLSLPPRIVVCPKCGARFDADSDVLIFLCLGMVIGFCLALLFFGSRPV
jgi:hypothetical protein